MSAHGPSGGRAARHPAPPREGVPPRRLLAWLVFALCAVPLRAMADAGPAPAPAAATTDANEWWAAQWRARNAPPPVVDPMDKAQDAQAVRTLAESGNASAQYALGRFLEQGLGVEQDQAQAIAWLRKAAEQGLDKAQYRLGLRYAAGQGVEKNPAQAAAWFTLAADQGFANAQYALGNALLLGEGRKRDPAEAYFWLSLAVLGGCEMAAKERDLAARLLPEERQVATRARVLAWTPARK